MGKQKDPRSTACLIPTAEQGGGAVICIQIIKEWGLLCTKRRQGYCLQLNKVAEFTDKQGGSIRIKIFLWF